MWNKAPQLIWWQIVQVWGGFEKLFGLQLEESTIHSNKTELECAKQKLKCSKHCRE